MRVVVVVVRCNCYCCCEGGDCDSGGCKGDPEVLNDDDSWWW